MNILVLGGTKFLGRHFVELALKKGHSLTLFHRGQTNPDLFPEATHIIGDRDKDLQKIKGVHFDAVLDTCCFFPSQLEKVKDNLRGKFDKYVFISSISVFDYGAENLSSSFDEDGKIVSLDIDENEDRPETYGARKFLCEEFVRQHFSNHFIVRPGLIVGPFDPSYRFPYWADRISEGGKVLCPADSNAPLQFIDVRDLVKWLLDGIENDIRGCFNAVSTRGELTLGEFLETVKETINLKSELVWIPEKYLRDNEVSCWSELPLWVFEESRAFLDIDSAKAQLYGLRFRPIVESIWDTFSWSKYIYRDQFLEKVLSREKEQELLKNFLGDIEE